MGPRILLVGLVLALAAASEARASQAGAPDPETEKGVRLVEEGDYDDAILALDTAARRLTSDSARSRELSRAYLYLGVAYLAKGHETLARARFRDALARARDLELEPEKFAPRVIELFEEARAEIASATRPAPKKSGGKGLLIGGAVAAAAGGAALALGGGGGGAADGGTAGTTPPRRFNGLLDPQGSVSAQYVLDPLGRSGQCEARLSWSEPRTEVRMFVLDAATSGAVAETNRVTETSSSVRWTCSPSATYRIELFLQEPLLRVTYELEVTVS